MQTRLRAFAPAKLNLYLHVLGRRSDGYHLLDSLVAFAACGDLLHATNAATLSLTIQGPFAAGLSASDDNLVLRAAHALAAEARIAPRAALILEKRLPIASGIGGGSADAAATLRLLSRLWDLTLEPNVLDRVAASLGADVPVCLHSRPVRMGGIGEVLRPAPRLPPCSVLLVNPGVPVATAAVFRARTGAFSAPADLPAEWATPANMAAVLTPLRNDLEEPACTLCPEIRSVLAIIGAQPGCLLARMSGSGATGFGLFLDHSVAQRAAGRIARPGWWVWSGPLSDQEFGNESGPNETKT
ncbi:MAG TPA: 4-(cytidine 5'-diphospho)-2-C-methyl-D-erythritol kinase [Acetobacteraceae bacterium]|nr:4-(cytidine 5'-diphospho)-2-C-methyl-D-erythritol kinase [Acetobacteraceae bacterium]